MLFYIIIMRVRENRHIQTKFIAGQIQGKRGNITFMCKDSEDGYAAHLFCCCRRRRCLNIYMVFLYGLVFCFFFLFVTFVLLFISLIIYQRHKRVCARARRREQNVMGFFFFLLTTKYAYKGIVNLSLEHYHYIHEPIKVFLK